MNYYPQLRYLCVCGRISKDRSIKKTVNLENDAFRRGRLHLFHFQMPLNAYRKGWAALSKPPVKWAIRIAVTAVFVALVNKSIRASDILLLVHRIHFWPLCGAVIIGAGSFFFQILRWRLILRSHALPCSIMVSLKTLLRGCLLAFITPGRIGELFRAVHIDSKRHYATMVAVVEERSFAVITTVAAGILCIIAQAVVSTSPLFIPLIIASIIFIAIFTVMMTEMISRGVLFKKSGRFPMYYDRVIEYLHRIRSLPFLPLALLSAGAHLLLLLQTALLFHMFGSGDIGRNIIAAGQAFSFMLLLPFFIANIGLREYAFSLFLARLSPDPGIVSEIGTIAFGVATFILFINLIFPALIGLLWMYTERNVLTDDRDIPKMHNPHSVAPTTRKECHVDTA